MLGQRVMRLLGVSARIGRFQFWRYGNSNELGDKCEFNRHIDEMYKIFFVFLSEVVRDGF